MKIFNLTLLATLGLLVSACGEKDVDDSGDSDADADTDTDADTDADADADADSDADADVGLAIVGSYTDSWGGDHVISETVWAQYGGSSNFNIDSYDNEFGYVIAQNDAGNAYFPELWSRMDWTLVGEDLYYCSIAYDAADASAAQAAGPADADDPTTGGCGGNAWTQLIAN